MSHLFCEINFAVNFLKFLETPASESTIFSSASILNGLAMILAATKGKTAEQILNIIGKDVQLEQILQYYSETSVNQNFGENRNRKGVKVTFANQFFVSQKETLIDEYSNLMQKMFRSNVERMDFEDKTFVVEKINEFVQKSTNGQIKKIIEPSDIKSNSTTILINALHFCGNWDEDFEPRKPEIFKSNPPRQVDMMLKQEMDWNYNKGIEWEALGIPYKDHKAFMYIVLPKNDDGLLDLIEKMDFSLFMECTKPNESHSIIASIPCFETSQIFDLKKELQKMGVTELFSDLCDLSEMFTNPNKIDKIIHKAAIKVDEYGTEASAVTQQGAMLACKKGYFKADHPFLYFITLNDTVKKGRQTEYPPKKLLFVGTFC